MQQIRLLDYERIVDADGNRLVRFGRYAGYAGMVDFLHSLGNRLLAMGYSTPFMVSRCSIRLIFFIHALAAHWLHTHVS